MTFEKQRKLETAWTTHLLILFKGFFFLLKLGRSGEVSGCLLSLHRRLSKLRYNNYRLWTFGSRSYCSVTLWLPRLGGAPVTGRFPDFVERHRTSGHWWFFLCVPHLFLHVRRR